jgi:hypothetical protein
LAEFTKYPQLSQLVSGKRVALVGPSPHLIGTNLGAKLDQYDMIARVGDYFPGAFEADYGSRTDVVFDSCDDRGNEDTIQKMYRYEQEIKQIKLVILPCLRASAGASNDGSSLIRNFQNNNLWGLPYWFIGVENFHSINDRVGAELNSGLASLMILLEHGPAELFLTGFSFYLQWNPRDAIGSVYRPGYYVDNSILVNFDWSTWTPNASHDQGRQIAYFKDDILARQGTVVKLDSYLLGLLKIQYSNVCQL